MCVCGQVCVRELQVPTEAVDASESELLEYVSSLEWVQGPELGLSEEQDALLTAEPSLPPHHTEGFKSPDDLFIFSPKN